jgi:hypothetical protein
MRLSASLLGILCFYSLVSSSYSIVIHLCSSNSTCEQHAYSSTYTTLGEYPQQTLQASIIFMSPNNFTNKWKFSPLTNTTEINGKIVVMKLKTPIYSGLYGSAIPPAIGREIQRVGGVGVVVKAQENVCFFYIHYKLKSVISNTYLHL